MQIFLLQGNGLPTHQLFDVIFFRKHELVHVNLGKRLSLKFRL